MAALSKYEDAASAFLSEYPIETVVHPDDLVNWATKHGNGLASDLLISDPGKMISALRRHLNNGGASRNLTEDQRFYLDIEDPKTKSMVVKLLAKHTSEVADQAFDKSIRGAMTPLKASQRAIDNHKLAELPPEQRSELEDQLMELVAAAEPLRNVMSKQHIDRYAKRLEVKGYSPQQARDMLEMAPTFSRFVKLQRVLS